MFTIRACLYLIALIKSSLRYEMDWSHGVKPKVFSIYDGDDAYDPDGTESDAYAGLCIRVVNHIRTITHSDIMTLIPQVCNRSLACFTFVIRFSFNS